jgi:fructose-1,6-bisphosphatase II
VLPLKGRSILTTRWRTTCEIAFARNVVVPDLAVAVVNLPRNVDLIDRVRDAGARLVLLKEGEIPAALLAAAEGTSIDAMLGIVGRQEILISACIVRALGGELQARLWPLNETERQLAGEQLGRIFSTSDFSPESLEVAVTGVTDSELLRGVRYGNQTWVTESLSMSTRSNTVRWVRSVHRRGGGGEPVGVRDAVRRAAAAAEAGRGAESVGGLTNSS